MTRTWSFIRDGTSVDTGSEPRRWSSGGLGKTPGLGLPKLSKLGVRENRRASMGTSTGGEIRSGDGGCKRREKTHECSSLSSPACASSTGRGNVACRSCIAVECRPGSGPLRRRKQIELGRRTWREIWVGEGLRKRESHGVGG